jgi:hypothetical protein
MARGILGVIVCLFLLAIAVGCGGGGSSDAAPLTKAQFVQQANSICRKGEEEKQRALLAAARERGGKTADQTQLEELITESALPPIRTMTSQLAELEAPSADKAGFKAMVRELERANAKAERNPSLALDPAKDPFRGADKRAGNYGLKECTRL